MAQKHSTTLLVAISVAAVLTMSAPSDALAGKECTQDHWHQGGSGSLPIKSKRAATKKAIRSWAGFTAWEYGNEWAHFKLAADRSINCKRHPGRRWTCDVEARPCKRTR